MNKVYTKIVWVTEDKKTHTELTELLNDGWQIFLTQPTDMAVLFIVSKLSDIVAPMPIAPLHAEVKKK